MTMTNNTILELLTKVNADAQSVVENLRAVYGKSEPLLNLLIEPELETAVHLRRHLNSILEGVKLENTFKQ
ncbi:hypothetical protein [Methylotenera sp.]|jgi:hypothetical protein|uniref:hypothetical protein n=2 Tax=Methylotenera sp. TaxID=2051956 RepID=UPI00271C49B6|nr:hypothetical protein [Methylotenera sp.]MDO9204375.1 hypothetical protein [Methylotenera sp.]MDP1658346.1 hypothetical protein [Methylotenera sp.]